jgi:pepF/M3 family oligoendopeptidase
MTDTAQAAPRWDVSAIFPSLDSRELAGATEGIVADLARLRALFDRHDVRAGEPRPPTAADLAALDEVLAATNDLLAELRRVGAYLHAFVTTDARNPDAARIQSRLQADTSTMATLTKRLEAWVARLGADALVAGSEAAAEHAFPLRRAARAASHQMSESEEDLAAALSNTGGRAWAKLHSDVTANLEAVVTRADGSSERLPMSVVRAMAADADPTTRRAAYDAEMAAWPSVEIPLAAALNAFKGEANVVNRRRGWDDSLDPALFANNVDRDTVAAMQEAVVAALPSFAAFLRAKAAYLGHGDRGLPWWELFAPIGDVPAIDWSGAVDAVHDAFATYSPSLAHLVRRAVDDRWIDGEPRAGKVGGAYCMPVEGDVSRVMMNFADTFDSVQTLAHELGHAYHNVNLGPRTPMQRQTPMALAETASIFCETLMVQVGLAATSDPGERLALLDTDIQGATQVVVDIHSRFLFERALSAERERGVLAPARLCELMTEAQADAYRDGLDPDIRHPYMWAVKGHYFTPYYNWPYTFGLLFGIGLYADYQRDPERFRLGYDSLLSSTGLDGAAELAAGFGIDIRDTAFWASSLDVIGARMADATALMAGRAAPGGRGT